MRMRSARVTLTLWYVAAMVVVLAVYAASVFVSTGVWKSLDDRLHGDFRWAAEMADQSPDGSLARFANHSRLVPRNESSRCTSRATAS